MPFQRVSIIKENTRKNSPTDLYVGENSYRSHCSLNIGGGKKSRLLQNASLDSTGLDFVGSYLNLFTQGLFK